MRNKELMLFNFFNEKNRIATATELYSLGIKKHEVYSFCKKQIISRVCKGVYRLYAAPVSQYYDFIEISKKVKNPVICLISALLFHNMTLQLPNSISVAISKNSYKSKISYPLVEYFVFPKELLSTGTITIQEPGWNIKIFNKEKTLIDCLVFQDFLDDEIIDDAFSKYMRCSSKVNIKKMERYAKKFGVLQKLHTRLASYVPVCVPKMTRHI